MRMHLKWKAANHYLIDSGYRMGESTWYRWRYILNKQKRERLYEIARIGYEEEHTDSVEEIETARKLLWVEYNKAVKPTERAVILEKIINTRPLLSSYYDSTREVLEKKPDAQSTIKEDNNIQITTAADSIPRVE